MNGRVVRIGGASAFWGDSAIATPQLVRRGQVDYLIYDYLSELTLSLLARARIKDPGLGYATDFVTVAMRSVLADLAAKNIRVVANAGGMNPVACGAALQRLCDELGVRRRIAVVTGDDVTPLLPALRQADVREMFTGAPLPDDVISANAYLGAAPVAAALAGGADIVITGRVADSALVLGILMHEFGWAADDWDRLAAGSVAGHILECGAQATGGLFTDWQDVPDWHDIGYPIAECRADGSFVVTKPRGTGGLVSFATVAEQLLYEIGDPANYILPDVIVDLRHVQMRDVGPDQVEVTGARGRPAPPTYKVSATYAEGWRCTATLSVIGRDATAKAERTANAILQRVRELLRALNLGEFQATDVEVLGAEAEYGPHSQTRHTREAILKIAVAHDDPRALEIFAREIAPAGTSFAPGTTGFSSGRAKPTRMVRLFSFLIDRAVLPPPIVELDGARLSPAPAVAHPGAAAAPLPPGPVAPAEEPMVEVPLMRVAWARSGDKGDTSNIGVIARRPEYLPHLRRELTPDRLGAWFAHLVRGPVERHELPGIGAFNFLLHQALAGGAATSLRNDALGKGFAQMALDIPVRLPERLLSP